MPATNRWRKIHHGTIYYVGAGHCSGKTDRQGYAIAIVEWEAIRDKMDNQPTEMERHLYDLLQERVELDAEQEQIIATLDDATLDKLGEQDDRVRKTVAQFRERKIIAEVTRKVRGKLRQDTVAAYAADFLHAKQDRHALGEMSASRVRMVGQHLHTIEDCLGKDTLVSTIDETTVQTYRKYLVDQIKAGIINKTTAGGRWHVFKEWTKSIYSIPILRNLDSRALSFGAVVATVVPWTVDEVATMLAKAPHERFQLWALLMLNCGMYAKDIADLRPDEVDWELGRIKRKRSKTQHLTNTPTVDYPLWGETFSLLQKHGLRTGDRVLVGRDGQPLV